MFGLPAANGLFSQLRSSHIVFISSQRFFQQLTAVLRPSLTIARSFLRPASSAYSSLIRLLYPNECAFKKKKKMKLKHPKPTRQQVRALKPQLRSLIIQLPKYAILTESLKKSCCLFVFPPCSPLVCVCVMQSAMIETTSSLSRNQGCPLPPSANSGSRRDTHAVQRWTEARRCVLLDLISEDIAALSVVHRRNQQDLIYTWL